MIDFFCYLVYGILFICALVAILACLIGGIYFFVTGKFLVSILLFGMFAGVVMFLLDA